MVERFSATLDAGLLDRFDRFLEVHGYENRSEGVRDLIRRALVADEWQGGKADVMGVITMVYDHHQPNLLNRITQIQHDCQASIVSTTHVHMDHHNCLEIVIVKGKASKVRDLADRLTTLKGVKSGNLSPATTGKGLT
ncbi:MAG: nickel-responsive transcriptional regulator NikR [Candidatus Eisenbacteria bacterium]